MNNLNQVHSEDTFQYNVTPKESKYSYHSMEDAVQSAQQLQQTGEVLNSTTKVKDYFVLHDDSSDREIFKILWLNNQYEAILCEEVSIGTINQAVIYPLEVVKSAILQGASFCIISHNGSLDVRQSDIRITKALKDALELNGVKLVDHIITAKGDTYSFSEYGQI